ncbi:MAG: hypothetical protein JO258_07870 [Alphaproteobacteria bacterium]|nr:hypothetical protein [Alphaproteobacteria bacterium]
MKIRYTHPHTRASVVEQASFAVSHAASSCGQTVLVTSLGPLTPAQWIGMHAVLLEAGESERLQFAVWLGMSQPG